MQNMQKLADMIDRANNRLGQWLSWLTLLLVLITAMVALLRYAAGLGWVWMQDAYLWVNGTMFMMGAAYTLLDDKHVRVDFIYQTLATRGRAAVDLFGTIVFLMPSIVAIGVLSYPYVVRSWVRLEGSGEAGGLPGIYLLKSVLVLFCIPLAAQSISLAIRCILTLSGHPGGRSPATDAEGPTSHA